MGVRLFTWNVNGIRSVAAKGFADWLAKERPDVVCLQEMKAKADQVPPQINPPDGYHAFWNPAQRPGYSGVATLCRKAPKGVRMWMGIPEFDAEGRTLVTDHGDFLLVNAYFPNGKSGPERLDYKMCFKAAIADFCDGLRKKEKKEIVLCGDVNTAHKPIDLARPEENEEVSGFLPAERAWIDRFLARGYVDVFRLLHPDLKDQYSWWSFRSGARRRNVGWRIDYHFVSEGLKSRVKEAQIQPGVTGSDHCPVLLELAS